MDNNYLNNSGNNTNYNNEGAVNGQTPQSNTQQSAYNAYGTQQDSYNAYGNQQNTYNAYGSQQGSYNAYGNQQQNVYNPYQQPVGGGKRQKKAKTRKNGFGATLGKCAAIALVFGLVAGGTFTGVSYAGNKALGITKESSTESKSSSDDSSNTVQQATSTGSAQDLLDVSAIAKEAMPSIVAITNTGTVSSRIRSICILQPTIML